MCQSSENYVLAKTKQKIKLKFLDFRENENPSSGSLSGRDASVL